MPSDTRAARDRHAGADQLVEGLAGRGIQARRYYATPLHQQPAMREWGTGVSLPGSEEAARTHVALPTWPLRASGVVAEVAGAVREALAGP